jgi:predicted nucleic acid-binding protein
VTFWLDTSVLVSLYVPEPRSARAARLVRRAGEPIPFSRLHELELATALRLRVFRRQAERKQVEATRARITEDLDAGILRLVAVDWPVALERAIDLADRYASRIGCRSLDLLHVSAAIITASDRFVTADRRQSTVARRAGLLTTRLR